MYVSVFQIPLSDRFVRPYLLERFAEEIGYVLETRFLYLNSGQFLIATPTFMGEGDIRIFEAYLRGVYKSKTQLLDSYEFGDLDTLVQFLRGKHSYLKFRHMKYLNGKIFNHTHWPKVRMMYDNITGYLESSGDQYPNRTSGLAYLGGLITLPNLIKELQYESTKADTPTS